LRATWDIIKENNIIFTVAQRGFENPQLRGSGMEIIKQFGDSFVREWTLFVQDEQLNEKQEAQFAKYMMLLREASEQISLTTITKPKNIVAHHFRDSLSLRKFVDMKTFVGLCDVGAGGGFPGIPLKIVFPHLRLVLVEVNNKKIKFLRRVIQELGLKKCEVYPLDWRTFLRKTEYELDLFCARASLQPEELLRMFKPSCPYKDAQLVYWASELWEPGEKLKSFVRQQELYRIQRKKRKLVFMDLK